MVDKNLFLYDLAVAAIFKDEAPYLKEWLDYHLLAGVEHFYLYNNDSSDNYKEVLAPYVEKNLVTLTDFPGKLIQYPAYDDAIKKFRFDCRYIAFIDLDEFIFPKTNQKISEVIDEILSDKIPAAGLGINWQLFGSNGQDKADYSRGVLERFTRRASSNWGEEVDGSNVFKKTINNPRLIKYFVSPHHAEYFDGKTAVNSNGEPIPPWHGNKPILADKIVLNHYYTKSKEEFEEKKIIRGHVALETTYLMEQFYIADRNEIFDDGILKYRAAREKIFSFENDEQRINRVTNSLVRTLTQSLSTDEKFFVGKLETFLTCRAVAEKFGIKIGDRSAEEFALALIYRTLVEPIKYAEVQMFLKALPEILSRPFPICRELKELTQNHILPRFYEVLKNGEPIKGDNRWKEYFNWLYIQNLLSLIKL